jgi:hypothetical protein
MTNADRYTSKKLYGRIKPTKGIAKISDPKNKQISHRILRRKLRVEDMVEIKDL